MKKILALAFAAFLITGCKKEDDNTNQNTCETPYVSVYNAVGNVRTLQVGANANTYDYVEAEYGPTGFTLGTGTKITTDQYYTLDNLANGAYDVYGRGNCGGSEWSEWSSVTSFVITDGSNPSCPVPMYLQCNHNGFDYTMNWSVNTGGDYFQVEFGPTGFAKGSGTTFNSADNYYSRDFTQGQTYDFYVRNNCGGSEFSAWAGPASFYAEF